MEFIKEYRESFCKFDVNFEKNEFELLKAIGKELILKDDEALINYAVNHILKEKILNKDNITKIKKPIKNYLDYRMSIKKVAKKPKK